MNISPPRKQAKIIRRESRGLGAIIIVLGAIFLLAFLALPEFSLIASSIPVAAIALGIFTMLGKQWAVLIVFLVSTLNALWWISVLFFYLNYWVAFLATAQGEVELSTPILGGFVGLILLTLNVVIIRMSWRILARERVD